MYPLRGVFALFQSTRPLRGGTRDVPAQGRICVISIHPPLAGRDKYGDIDIDLTLISIHPPLAGRDRGSSGRSRRRAISIHPPLAGRDRNKTLILLSFCISIHPPLAGRDPAKRAFCAGSAISIHPPLAGRDRHVFSDNRARDDFNPPAPCGAGPALAVTSLVLGVFQSTRPLRGGTLSPRRRMSSWLFQSTRPLRGGTIEHPPGNTCRGISIHPPLAGRDSLWLAFIFCVLYFNPPAPCGAGLQKGPKWPEMVVFQSTRPLRGGTGKEFITCSLTRISIHPPLAGRDQRRSVSRAAAANFNPPAPCGAGLFAERGRALCARFQSTRPLRGGTAILHKKTVQNIAYCTKSAFTLAVLSGFLALMRPFFLPNVHKFRCEPSEESLLAPRSHAYTIRTPSG